MKSQYAAGTMTKTTHRKMGCFTTRHVVSAWMLNRDRVGFAVGLGVGSVGLLLGSNVGKSVGARVGATDGGHGLHVCVCASAHVSFWSQHTKPTSAFPQHECQMLQKPSVALPQHTASGGMQYAPHAEYPGEHASPLRLTTWPPTRVLPLQALAPPLPQASTTTSSPSHAAPILGRAIASSRLSRSVRDPCSSSSSSSSTHAQGRTSSAKRSVSRSRHKIFENFRAGSCPAPVHSTPHNERGPLTFLDAPTTAAAGA